MDGRKRQVPFGDNSGCVSFAWPMLLCITYRSLNSFETSA
jgi:hypothetical protein